jgi:hypothetical protein
MNKIIPLPELQKPQKATKIMTYSKLAFHCINRFTDVCMCCCHVNPLIVKQRLVTV